MRVYEYNHAMNEIELVKGNRLLKIGKGYYNDGAGDFQFIYTPDHHTVKGKKYVYRFPRFGDLTNPRYHYIALDEAENFEFLFIQGKLWIHDKENVMWLINILVALLAILATIKAAKC
jgi:hypothetical protein